MARNRSPIALDLRDRFVRAVQLERRAGGIAVLAAHAVPVAGGGAARAAQWIEAGRQLLRDGSFRGRDAVAAIGHDAFDTRRIRIPTDKLDEAADLIAREIRSQPDAAADATILPIPVVDLFDQGQTKREFLCCSARGEAIAERIAVLEALGLVPTAIDLEPCALVRPFAHRAQHESSLHLDFGLQRSSITIVRAGVPVLMKTSRVGSDRLTQLLAQGLHLDVPSLRDLDRVPDVDHRDLHEAVVAVLAEPLEQLLCDLGNAVRYCGALFQGRAVTQLRGSGDIAELPGLLPYLGRRIGITAEVADPFDGIAATDLPTTAGGGRSDYCTAMGLALRGVA
ncbi:MAG: pilus assembly protein PilM [Planctomycetes bacterium]|nr:pilus assembly protein PilM [Planctomycetota bacterium]